MDDENDFWSIDIPEPVERMADEKDQVSIHIMKNLNVVKPVSKNPSDPCIGIVPKHLRDVNEKAYEPQIIAIGPYHRDKPHLQVTEEHKRRYLKMLLQRKEEDGVKRYVKRMGKLEERARKCYTHTVCLEKIGFVEMLLLDACFIVGLFRGDCWQLTDNDPVFGPGCIRKTLCRDLLLAENQIPFFVLSAFFQMTATQKERKSSNHFLALIITFFEFHLPYQCYKQNPSDNFKITITEQKHLLSIVHDRWVYGVAVESPISGTRKCNIIKIVISLLRKKNHSDEGDCESNRLDDSDEDDLESIRFATNLKESGIKFSRVKGNSLFDIKFENGIMKIPRLTIEDDTESFLRNLIVYEQLYPKNSNPFVDYMNFMDSLINSEKDVELLCQHKILRNLLGDDKVVAEMFNRLGDSVTLSGSDRYRIIHENVNKHCDERWNKWIANLRHNYFNTPWALISFLAAVFLLLLTLVQTVFSVHDHFK